MAINLKQCCGMEKKKNPGQGGLIMRIVNAYKAEMNRTLRLPGEGLWPTQWFSFLITVIM